MTWEEMIDKLGGCRMEYVVLFIDDRCRQASTTLYVESYESVSEVFDREFPNAIDLIDYFEA